MSIEKLQELSKDYYSSIKSKEDAISKIFLSTLKEEIFDKYPTVESVGWPQYTPYFNDGEPCFFIVHSNEESIRVNQMALEDMDADEVFDAATFEKVCEIVSEILFSTPDSVLEELGESFIEVDRDLNVRCKCINHD